MKGQAEGGGGGGGDGGGGSGFVVVSLRMSEFCFGLCLFAFPSLAVVFPSLFFSVETATCMTRRISGYSLVCK